ncbi:hypothetical protein EV702DRAFT_158621 [Suillus placidus]|uniref:Uncharacterized protein n=1 Tax=Suillus placidus TaxID=48579 RepID=A0A9P7D371_9AGAM|nr:hypothetical protein EV702DRAFT_158621 [Suillus placidus]
MSDGRSRNTRKGRSASLHLPKRCDPTPVPPTLTNSPHLLSPYSMFRRKPVIMKTPSQEDDEWLRDMVPMNREQGTFDDTLSLSAASVQKQRETPSQESLSPSPSGSSFPRHNMYRSWSSPSTSTSSSSSSIITVANLQSPSDLTDG